MATPLPREPSGGSGLHQTIKQLIRCVRERTLLPSNKYALDHSTAGVSLRFKQEKAAEGGAAGMNYRGNWSTFVHYEEDDVVMVRNGVEGSGPEAQGTFICIREHDSDSTNYPRELTQEGVDPGTGSVDDTWRTLAAGAWDELTIKGFPVPVAGGPSIDLPAYTHISGGAIECNDPSGFAGIGSGEGSAAGSATGSGVWSLAATDLPAGETVKFRLMTICIGGEKFTAWFAMSAPKPVP